MEKNVGKDLQYILSAIIAHAQQALRQKRKVDQKVQAETIISKHAGCHSGTKWLPRRRAHDFDRHVVDPVSTNSKPLLLPAAPCSM